METVLTAKNVRYIPKKVDNISLNSLKSTVKKRVAAYARVSTDSDEQATSYEAQVNYYTNYIKQKSDWVYVDVYSDEGISGTSIKKRDGFNRMINDALAGKIDLIITKSISRFARNTVDSLNTIRKLKEKNIEVFFEKENIGTLDGKGELLLTIMSSISQEESRSISQNVTWGIRKQYADGKVKMSTKRFLGYDKDKNGKLIINKKEAEIVKLIYKLFLLGYSTYKIKLDLESKNIKSPGGTKIWRTSTIKSILRNEKFKGDALLQKYYTVDFLTKKQAKNNGEVPQYYVTDDHEAIIDKKTFDAVQIELEKRDISYSCNDIITSKIRCGECNALFGRKIWHSNDKYKKVIYRCNKKYDNDKKCNSGIVTEEEIKDIFIKEFNKLNKSISIKNGLINDIIDNADKDLQLKSKLETEKAHILDRDNELLELSSRTNKDYTSEHNKLIVDFEKVQSKLNKVNDAIKEKQNKLNAIETYINKLKSSPAKIKEFDIVLFATIVDKILIFKDKRVVIWKDGSKSVVNKKVPKVP